MPYYSPLRYPGGKRRLVPTVQQLLDANDLKEVEYVEPYAGGAAIAWALLLEGRASKIHINDLNRAVYAFWHSVMERNDELCQAVQEAPLTMQEWLRQREIYRNRDDFDLFELGFATFYLNRTNRSGILGGGVIGGIQQKGKWKIDARFNRKNLIERISAIGGRADDVTISNEDAIDFAERLSRKLGKKGFFFFDPPYIDNGDDLYLNDYDIPDHEEVSKRILAIDSPWIVTYDYGAAERKLYEGMKRVCYDLNYSAQARYSGREAMFLSPSLQPPQSWSENPKDIVLTGKGNRYPIKGSIEDRKMKNL